ncbi:MAG TPA: c-type cytochrome, partial [Casimicrobiaceae bacterium]|nr:c-type cytochrome [Casimicrobiaceae bacterium]
AGFPRLAGLGKGYVARQIEAFARDQRASAIMAPIAKALTPPESSAVAGYFAALTPPPISFSNARRQVPAAALAQDGRWQESRLPACVQCHGPDGTGVGDDFPSLAGQPAAYVAAQLRAWQQGTRPAGPQGLMQVIAKRLTAEDIEAVSGYFGVASVDAGKAAEEPTQPTHQVTLAPVSGGARTGFAPPPENAIPDDELGRLVRLGKLIFTETQKYAAAYVGNDLRCSNCHLDAGRLGHSAPLWGAYVAYPQYRAKTRHVDSYAERLQGCFLYSMNGSAPPLGSEVLAALETYSYWLATGAPVNTRIEGSGYPRLPSPKDGADYDRGRRVYDDKCALCHRSNGEGQRAGAAQVFPPLWGPRSYNWGAGMHQVNNAAAFIKANMPFGDAGTLTEQQAWDVAYYMDAHERPQDPRFTVSITDTRRKFHDSADSLYGVTVNGQMLGRGTDPEKGR